MLEPVTTNLRAGPPGKLLARTILALCGGSVVFAIALIFTVDNCLATMQKHPQYVGVNLAGAGFSGKRDPALLPILKAEHDKVNTRSNDGLGRFSHTPTAHDRPVNFQIADVHGHLGDRVFSAVRRQNN